MQAGASVPSYSGGLAASMVVSYPSISVHFNFQFFLQSAFSFVFSQLSAFNFQLFLPSALLA